MKSLVLLAACCALLSTVVASSIDNCDWTGSGTLQMSLSRGVQPVYLRCNQGTIRWQYPLGALRIVLQHTQHSGEFSACIRRANTSSGARIYLASKKRLHPVFMTEDSMDLVRCVVGDPVTLYVEADPGTGPLSQGTTEFSYYLKRAVKKIGRNYVDDCEPCTEDQLLRHYCTSDFVIQGTVSNLFHNKELEITELTVHVSQMYRSNGLNEFFEPQGCNNSLPNAEQPEYIVLHRPLYCGTKAGTGEYLFLGKWILGNPNLNCIPRVAEWKKVRRKAMISGINECLL